MSNKSSRVTINQLPNNTLRQVKDKLNAKNLVIFSQTSKRIRNGYTSNNRKKMNRLLFKKKYPSPNSTLLEAIHNEDVSKVNDIITHKNILNLNMNRMNYNFGDSLLHYTIKLYKFPISNTNKADAQYKILKKLIDVSDLKKKNNKDFLPLHIACSNYPKENIELKFKLIKLLIDKDSETINMVDRDGKIPLHHAVTHISDIPTLIKTIHVFKKHGVNLNIEGQDNFKNLPVDNALMQYCKISPRPEKKKFHEVIKLLCP